VRHIEEDRSWSSSGRFLVLENVSMSKIGSYAVLWVLDDGEVHLEHEMRCANAPLNVTYPGPGKSREVNFSMWFESGKVHVMFEEIQ
jgi:hypothetical protein